LLAATAVVASTVTSSAARANMNDILLIGVIGVQLEFSGR